MSRIHDLAADHAEWSQSTFGADTARGPQGPLAHLAKEVREVQADDTDVYEYADCFLLLIDAARRAGHSIDALLDAAQHKLEINKTRNWSAPADDGSIEHIR